LDQNSHDDYDGFLKIRVRDHGPLGAVAFICMNSNLPARCEISAMRFDLGDSTTQVLICSALVAAGTAASIMGGPTLGVAIAVQTGSVAASVLASHFFGLRDRDLGSPDGILHNHDLRRVVGDAIRVVVRRSAKRVSWRDSWALKGLANQAPSFWEGFVVPPERRLAAITEARLPAFFATASDEFPKLRALEDESAWEFLLREIAGTLRFPPSTDALKLAASDLYCSFHIALRGVLKQDYEAGNKAYRGLMLMLMGENQAATKRVEDLVKSVGEHVALVHTDLKQDLKVGFTAISGQIEQLQAGFPLPAASTGPLVRFKAPPKNKHFLDVHDILKELHKEPKTARVVALYGWPGVGKTQAATAYVHKHRDNYTASFWVNAESLDTAAAEMATIARGLHLHIEKEAERTVEALKAWFDNPENAGWLLVLDNANDLDLVRRLLPTAGRGRVLLTTNDPAVRRIADLSIELKTLDPNEGAEALLALWKPDESPSVEDREAAQALSIELDGLLLAIDQAAVFIAGGSTPARYLSLCRERRAELLRQRGSLDHESVTITFLFAFEQIEKRAPAAADLLRLCAVLAPETIPEEILTAGAADLGDVLGPAMADDIARHNTIVAANRLVRYDPKERTLSIHRLTQAVLRDELDTDLRRAWIERAVLAVDKAFPSVDYANWPTCDRLLPHAIECGRGMAGAGITSREAARVLHQTAYYLLERGNYHESGPLFRRCLEMEEATLGRDHPNTLTTRNNIASWTGRVGDSREALRLFSELLPDMERVLGRNHPDTLTTRNNIASWTGELGDSREALRLFGELLPDQERVLGHDHPDTLDTLEWLGVATIQTGNRAEGCQLLQEGRARAATRYGDDHPLTSRFQDAINEHQCEGS
jgi:tetratricopeptide (TPR) repeat protein